MKYAFVFPGQGAQEVGMGRDFCDQHRVAKEVFDEADDALNCELSRMIFEGPEDELAKTEITQPAILTASIAMYRTFTDLHGSAFAPAFFAGHSLGEYTALVAAGALPLADAVRLVHTRGSLMQKAVPLGEGAMSAVIGLDRAAAAAVCEEASQAGVVSPANVNSPTQIVISGASAAVARAGEIALAKGASKVIPLKVSAPFHCALMRPVADKLEGEFAAIKWAAPSSPIMANASASPAATVDDVLKALYAQTYSPVLWADGVEAMARDGVEAFVEFGPGSVLTSLIKRTVKGMKTVSVNKVADMEKAASILGGGA